ncbi:hypothetical protein [Gelidibacter maritimus]|uniref:Uncharacterized protein n=1 Tax=Gelidibacter maritimus TaxID=2761487 RepID=A0A7W2R3T4_9FLAO|nr:hypothetical protein [Gelidibacter maritimus]MBA6152320.1 hypothetical protein [Gelidibacter maritimus]
MKSLLYISFLFSIALFSQERITTEVVGTFPIKADQITHIDNFGALFYTVGTTFYKKEDNQNYSYSNVQLGAITSANAFNPLKINLFYKKFNTVLILDNRLSDIYRVNFSAIQPYKNITHISTGSDNTIWIFNQDTQHLELFDYKTNKTRATTMPVESEVLDLTSNYNYSWLLTEKFLYIYNYFGSTIAKIKNDGFIQIDEDNGNLIILKDQKLYFLSKKTSQLIPIHLPELLIKQFLVTNESLYIYSDETLHQFQLKFI